MDLIIPPYLLSNYKLKDLGVDFVLSLSQEQQQQEQQEQQEQEQQPPPKFT